MEFENLENKKDDNENDEDHDEVFDTAQTARQNPQQTSNRTQIELKIQDFARDWARTLKQSEYKTEIFRGLTQLGLMENRRNKLLSSFEVVISTVWNTRPTTPNDLYIFFI